MLCCLSTNGRKSLLGANQNFYPNVFSSRVIESMEMELTDMDEWVLNSNLNRLVFILETVNSSKKLYQNEGINLMAT